MRNIFVRTTRGAAVFTADSAAPRVLMIHGFRRSAGMLDDWRRRIPGLAFLHLPGHSGAPALPEVSVEAWIEAFRELFTVFPEPPLVIAESLGAVIALSLPARALIAVEPLLSVDRLWTLRRTFERDRAAGSEITVAEEALFAKPFGHLLERISAPTLVLAGDVPLLPERPIVTMPSVLTDEDFAAYARHPRVEALRVAGGHNLLLDNAEGVMAAARPFMLRHGYLPA